MHTTYIHTYIHVHTYKADAVHFPGIEMEVVYTCMHTYMHTYTHIYICIYIAYMYTCTYKHIHTDTHTDTDTHIHAQTQVVKDTYTHTHTQTQVVKDDAAARLSVHKVLSQIQPHSLIPSRVRYRGAALQALELNNCLV